MHGIPVDRSPKGENNCAATECDQSIAGDCGLLRVQLHLDNLPRVNGRRSAVTSCFSVGATFLSAWDDVARMAAALNRYDALS